MIYLFCISWLLMAFTVETLFSGGAPIFAGAFVTAMVSAVRIYLQTQKGPTGR